jgi:NADH-quinone oxidoreductase subunit G
MVTITINGQAYAVAEGQNLLQACLSLGFDLPYFCWHPALGSVGACRQCAVKHFRDDKDKRGELIMACMTPVAEGLRIAIDDPEASQFRASVIEWMMINHPHDCPVCEEGGECHLQDMTVMTGHTYRRHRFPKRTYRNQDLGPFIRHEMNRCIQCYRCLRYYRDYAGGRDLDVFASAHRVYFGRFRDGPLESEFSGNLVEICPTGVFTDRSLGEHYTRKWDLQTAPSICVHCSLGCNTLPGERYGLLRRVRNRFHHQINGYFLCDRGRYGYDFVNSKRRIRQPLARDTRSAEAQPVSKEDACRRAASFLGEGGTVIGIGSPRASLEANFALRCLVGPAHFHAGLSVGDRQRLERILSILQKGPVPSASLQATGLADAVLVLGEDVTQSAPMLALNLRRLSYHKAAEAAAGFRLPEWNDRAVRTLLPLHPPDLFIAGTGPTRLDDAAQRAVRLTPGELVRFAAAVWAALEADAPPAAVGLGPELQALAHKVAQALLNAQRPLVVADPSSPAALVETAADITWRLKHAGRDAALFFCLPECNSMGLTMMAARPLEEAVAKVTAGGVDTLVVLENDLYRRAPAADVNALLQKVPRLIVIDHTSHATTAGADVLLPSATFAEAAGTLVNNEGRAQRHYAVFPPAGPVRAGWRWLQELGRTGGDAQMPAWTDGGDVLADLAAVLPVFKAASEAQRAVSQSMPPGGVARQAHRFSGRTAMMAHLDIHEPRPPEDPDSALRYSMEGYHAPPPAVLVPRFWAAGWNSVQALHKFQAEAGGPLPGADVGVRLIEPQPSDSVTFFEPSPPEMPGDADDYWVIALYHIFGSEELSALAPAIAQRIPDPYLALGQGDPLAVEGAVVRLQIHSQRLQLPVRIVAGLPQRTAGLPVGLPDLPAGWAAVLPAVLKITRSPA